MSGSKFTFIDLFAGIGGFRLALEKHGGKCLFTSEWDKYAQQTYEAWYGDKPHGDITKIDAADIPDHDILCAGFPCQPFSLAGVSKKNSLGRSHGFDDEKQGNLFFEIMRIVEAKRPPVLFLENVKNLKSHDKGNTWKVIEEHLIAANYTPFSRIIDAKYWVPQHRERIFIVCFDNERFGMDPGFEFPEEPSEPAMKFGDILEKGVDPKYILSDHLWQYLQDYADKHRAAGNGFGFGIADPKGISRTISARYHKDGSEILIGRGKGKNPRRLTPREACRLMGFPDDKPQVVSDTQAYRQFGNAVVPLAVEHVLMAILPVLRKATRKNQKISRSNAKAKTVKGALKPVQL
ncbi:MAG: DNA (cytosine-5-)-methyltransferase [Planctomycetales bacterium]|nr:DNA (cytosine-5-)-methyltransferase [bacterium]UNM06873.1 MAG: DNA (cytosine-5-)-methyltransferase [Planctomycetales bacterium]